MKLYSTARLLRGIALGAATGEPSAAFVSEIVSCVPLLANSSSTFGGILSLMYLNGFAEEALNIIEAPMRETLEWEISLLALTTIAIFISNTS